MNRLSRGTTVGLCHQGRTLERSQQDGFTFLQGHLQMLVTGWNLMSRLLRPTLSWPAMEWPPFSSVVGRINRQ